MRILWLVGGLVVAAAGAFLLFGTGGGPSLAEAAKNMQAENMRVHLTLRVNDKSGTQRTDLTGVLSADGTRGRVVGTATVPGMAKPMQMTVVSIHGDGWIDAPLLRHFMPAGKRWMHTADTGATSTLTPSELVRFLADARGVKRMGQDTIRGQRADHYRGTVDPRDLGERIGGDTKRRLDALLGGRDVPLGVEAWVGPDGLPLRVRAHVTIESATADIVSDILAYGVKVDVAPPAGGQVIEEDQLNRRIDAA